MTTPFADPATPAGVDYNELQGSLLMIEVLGHEDHIPTVNTPPGEKSPAMRANITVLDGPKANHVYEDAFVFPKVLQGQLRSRIGRIVLGRLTKGDAKAGQTAPWKLASANDADRRTAEAALSRNGTGGAAPASSQSFGGTGAQAEPPF